MGFYISMEFLKRKWSEEKFSRFVSSPFILHFSLLVIIIPSARKTWKWAWIIKSNCTKYKVIFVIKAFLLHTSTLRSKKQIKVNQTVREKWKQLFIFTLHYIQRKQRTWISIKVFTLYLLNFYVPTFKVHFAQPTSNCDNNS